MPIHVHLHIHTHLTRQKNKTARKSKKMQLQLSTKALQNKQVDRAGNFKAFGRILTKTDMLQSIRNLQNLLFIHNCPSSVICHSLLLANSAHCVLQSSAEAAELALSKP